MITRGGPKKNGQPGIMDKFLEFHMAMYVYHVAMCPTTAS